MTKLPSSDKIKHDKTKLKSLGLIKRLGPAKGGHWPVLEN